jgi:NAD(P)-dependent dehydrogenase (short-subunit alcohol dehydrogenase family)
VVITYQSRREDAEAVVAEIAKRGGTAAALQLDTSSISGFPAFADALREELGRVFGREDFDILVNNAGIGINASFAETTEEMFDRLMNIHLKGVFFLTQQLLPLIADGGRIVNLSSGLARFTAPGFVTYGTMKGAVEVLTRYLAKELGARGISVNAVAPGPIETDFGGGVVRDNADANAFYAAQTALGRVGLPDDVGGAIAALTAPESRWITAQRIEVSGGIFI